MVGYRKLISNKCEWNNCFTKYETLDKNISSFIFYRLKFSAILTENFPRYKCQFQYSEKLRVRVTVNREPIKLAEIQYPVFAI